MTFGAAQYIRFSCFDLCFILGKQHSELIVFVCIWFCFSVHRELTVHSLMAGFRSLPLFSCNRQGAEHIFFLLNLIIFLCIGFYCECTKLKRADMIKFGQIPYVGFLIEHNSAADAQHRQARCSL